VRGGRGLQPAVAARHPITFAQEGKNGKLTTIPGLPSAAERPKKLYAHVYLMHLSRFSVLLRVDEYFSHTLTWKTYPHTRVCARKHTYTYVSQLPVCYCKWTTLYFSLSLCNTPTCTCGYEYISRRRATGRGRRSRAT